MPRTVASEAARVLAAIVAIIEADPGVTAATEQQGDEANRKAATNEAAAGDDVHTSELDTQIVNASSPVVKPVGAADKVNDARPD